ncbi:hypothetical protein LH707_002975 [Vibrio cholerae]|nr:hypothetical protein [Vibrio cholerae]EIJ0935545.1 hypothetical protein [Vibrio cholerae]
MVSVIICGLVRDKSRLLNKLQNYIDWREQGRIDQIIYSTWIGELENYAGLRNELESRNVELIEIEEPRLVLKGGHQLHQMLSLYYGLSAIKNKNQFILRTRVDLADNHENMLFDFEYGTEQADDFAEVGLKHKILIEYSQMAYPFLCGDAQFFGHFDDILKLINLSAEMELVFNRLAVEQTFFFNPFINCKIFRQHFLWNLPHISEISDRRDSQIEDILSRDLFKDVIISWLVILNCYFKIGWGEYKNIKIEISNLKDAFNYNQEFKIIGGDKSDVIADHSFVSAIINHLEEEEIFRIKFMVKEKEFNNLLEINPDIYDQYESFSRKYSDLPSPKCSRAGSNKNLIKGAAQHFFVKNEHDNASRRYHEQITALRRENDYLRKELNINITNSQLHRFLNRLLPRKLIEHFKYKLPFLTDFYARKLMKKKIGK